MIYISSVGMNEIIHANKATLMSVIGYGFVRYGGYGTTANVFSSEIGTVRMYYIGYCLTRPASACDQHSAGFLKSL